MNYFKIIQGGMVIGAGHQFLRWFDRVRRFCFCEMEGAQCVQDAVSGQLYRADWLERPPAGAPQPEAATVTIIGAAEYDEIIAELEDGEEIPMPVDPEPEPTPEPGPEPEPERPMTVSEMREKILELTSMAAKEDIPKGAFFVLHDTVYQAADAIEKGREIRPGVNCVKKVLEDLI